MIKNKNVLKQIIHLEWKTPKFNIDGFSITIKNIFHSSDLNAVYSINFNNLRHRTSKFYENNLYFHDMIIIFLIFDFYSLYYFISQTDQNMRYFFINFLAFSRITTKMETVSLWLDYKEVIIMTFNQSKIRLNLYSVRPFLKNIVWFTYKNSHVEEYFFLDEKEKFN